MSDQAVEFQKRRELPEVIAASFQFIRAESGALLKYTLIYALPFIVVLAALQLVITSEMAGIQETLLAMLKQSDLSQQERLELLTQSGGVYKKYFLLLFFNIFVQSLFMAVIYSYIHAYLDRGKGNFTSSEITSAFFTNAYITLGTSLIVAIISLIGFIFCIIPGILLLNSLSLAVFIAVYEKKGIGYAITRSFNLVKLQWWGTFLLNLIGIIITSLVTMALAAPASIGQESKVIFEEGETIAQAASDWRVWVFLFSSVIGSILSVITFVFLAFQYFNLKECEKDFPGIN
jgi:hypothetical protein